MMIINWLNNITNWIKSEDLSDFKIIETKEVYADGSTVGTEYHIESADYIFGFKGYKPHVYKDNKGRVVTKTFFRDTMAREYWEKYRKDLGIKTIISEVKLD